MKYRFTEIELNAIVNNFDTMTLIQRFDYASSLILRRAVEKGENQVDAGLMVGIRLLDDVRRVIVLYPTVASHEGPP